MTRLQPADNIRRPPPWLFGITNVPFGVAGGYVAVAVPFLLSNADVPLERIAAISAAALIPSAYQFFWAPVVDIGPKRRSWLILFSLLGSLCLAATLLLKLPDQLDLFTILTVAGQGLTGMVGSCNGGLIANTLGPDQRGKVSGWLNAGNLGGAALGGGLVLTLARSHQLFGAYALHAAGAAMVLMNLVASLAVLFVDEPERPPQRPRAVFRAMFTDVWGTLRLRSGWSGVLFCLSPVGTAALLNLLSGVARDYQASPTAVEFVNGYWGGLVTAAGSLFASRFLDRIDARAAYLGAGALSALACGAMMAMPLRPLSYTVGSLVYLFVAGICYAAFSALVFTVIGKAGASASTQYTLFTAAGNQAISYVTWIDGKGYAHRGMPGLLGTDALLNLLGIVILATLLKLLFRAPKAGGDTSPIAAVA